MNRKSASIIIERTVRKEISRNITDEEWKEQYLQGQIFCKVQKNSKILRRSCYMNQILGKKMKRFWKEHEKLWNIECRKCLELGNGTLKGL